MGEGDNFWIIEAVACYMESLQIRNGYATLGGADEGRMPAARHRLLKDNFYCPLAELVALGKQDLQHHTDIARLYSESAGLATFLLSRHGAATVQYLESVYTGNADRDTLARLTGCSYSELDAGIGRSCRAKPGRPGPSPVRPIEAARRRRNRLFPPLCSAGTSVHCGVSSLPARNLSFSSTRRRRCACAAPIFGLFLGCALQKALAVKPAPSKSISTRRWS